MDPRTQVKCVALIAACLFKGAGGWGTETLIRTAREFEEFLLGSTK